MLCKAGVSADSGEADGGSVTCGRRRFTVALDGHTIRVVAVLNKRESRRSTVSVCGKHIRHISLGQLIPRALHVKYSGLRPHNGRRIVHSAWLYRHQSENAQMSGLKIVIRLIRAAQFRFSFLPDATCGNHIHHPPHATTLSCRENALHIKRKRITVLLVTRAV
jgi:hypothetical protein